MMEYYSTNGVSPSVTLSEAVVNGLAPDKGLYMPRTIKRLPDDFFEHIDDYGFHEIACRVAEAFFGEDVPQKDLNQIVTETLSFDCPVVPVRPGVWSLELFHGPTLAFKDVGARFMARMLRYFVSAGTDLCQKGQEGPINVLVATSGDTGSAVANGFLGVEGIRVYVLYPRGKVSPVQESQFTTLGQNITAVEVDGTFDDCQALVKSAFVDPELRSSRRLTSANSINVARFLPQSFYYFWAYAQMKRAGLAQRLVVSVPSGNFGNLAAGLFAYKMGLPITRFIAANNANDVFFHYLKTGVYEPRPSLQTIANAMDVGNPSNFARIMELYHGNHDEVIAEISGATYQDEAIRKTIRDCQQEWGYLLDPHGACAYQALIDGLCEGETGIFLETAHPAKFCQTVEQIIGRMVDLPDRLAAFMRGKRQVVSIPAQFDDFKSLLLTK